MILKQLYVAGDERWHSLSLDAIEPQLTVIHGGPQSGKSTIARLACDLLYGKADNQWRSQGQASPAAPDGEVHVQDDEHVDFVLLRTHADGGIVRRTASKNGGIADQQSIDRLLYRRLSHALRQNYAVDFSSSPSPMSLLSEDFARKLNEFADSGSFAFDEPSERRQSHGRNCQVHGSAIRLDDVDDSRKLDDLIHRRDALSLKIEEALCGTRQHSVQFKRQLRDLERQLVDRQQNVESLQAELLQLDGELAAVETRLRYFSLESVSRRGPSLDHEKHQRQIDQLDAEIAECRRTVAELQAREADVRRQLADVQPDGVADSASCLMDQRATIGVLERLLNDLDAEVSQLARSHQPGRCPGVESHAKMAPVADMLRQQLYTLCGQVTEQERNARRFTLTAESRQLIRAQSDLSERLEHLLARRQALVREKQVAGQPITLTPQPPVVEYCQCDRHDRFVRESDAMVLARTDRADHENDAHSRRCQLHQRQTKLRRSLAQARDEVNWLQSQRDQLQVERAALIKSAPVDELRQQLQQVERQIQCLLRTDATGHVPDRSALRPVWKASDTLAKLTGGELVQLRRPRDGQPAQVIDRRGRTAPIESLTAAQCDQLYVALTLAFVSAQMNRGAELPLILDEPFLRQDAVAAAAMVGVLEQFAREGRQVLLFTENQDAAARFESLGVAAVRLEDIRDRQSTGADEREEAKPPPAESEAPSEAASAVRVVRDGVGDHGPRLHVSGNLLPSDADHKAYFLAESASLAEFPVLGAESEAQFRKLNMQTVGDLLNADATEVADKIAAANVTARVVKMWQSHMSLMCFVPGVSLDDAQVLSAAGIDDLDDLIAADVDDLIAKVEAFLDSDRAERFAPRRRRFTRRLLSQWRRAARVNRDRWRQSRRRFGRRRTRNSESNAPSGGQPRRPARRRNPRRPQPDRPLEFRLSLDNPIVDAPSVGEKAAQRLATVGIRTVADLLNADAESTAQELADRNIPVERLVAWQRQARLVCQIPNLRAYGARLLVGCGLTESYQIAQCDPAELAKRVRRFCRTKQGRRILRNGKPPSVARIAEWVQNANHRRPLEAA